MIVFIHAYVADLIYLIYLEFTYQKSNNVSETVLLSHTYTAVGHIRIEFTL